MVDVARLWGAKKCADDGTVRPFSRVDCAGTLVTSCENRSIRFGLHGQLDPMTLCFAGGHFFSTTLAAKSATIFTEENRAGCRVCRFDNHLFGQEKL
jgi:hypothetical protein